MLLRCGVGTYAVSAIHEQGWRGYVFAGWIPVGRSAAGSHGQGPLVVKRVFRGLALGELALFGEFRL